MAFWGVRPKIAAAFRGLSTHTQAETDVDDLLGRLCCPPRTASSEKTPRIDSEKFFEISTLLKKIDKQHGRPNHSAWSKRPRTYCVLRNIARLDLLDAFSQEGLTDFDLPYSDHTLPEFVHGPELRGRFLDSQLCVLTDARSFEEPGGPHVSIDGSAQQYLHHKKDLGQGGFGAVDEVMSRLSLKSYARKRVVRGDNNSYKNRKAQKYLIEELNTLKALSHRHLVRYIGSYTDESHIAFLMAPVADHNLKNFLQNPSNFPGFSVSLRYFYGCLGSAVNYLHKNGIRHRDIKPSNILLKDGRVFVTDFGTAFNTSKARRTAILDRNVPRSISYLSPEAARDEPCHMSSDMWSLGVVFLELSTVLLGKKLSTFRKHLENSASDKKTQPFVWDRIRATYDWLDDLRMDNTGAEQDNEVLTWTRDLLKKQPKERLNSGQLMQRISCSPSFHSFCCFECWPDYERSNHLPKDLRNEEITAIDAMDVNDHVTALFEQEPVDNSKDEETERHQTIEDWINSTHAESANFRTLFSSDTRSELSSEFTPNFIINQDTEEPFNDAYEEELEEEEKTILAQPPSSNNNTLMPEVNPPPSFSVPGSFPQFEDYDDDREEFVTPRISFNDSNRDSTSELAHIATIEHNPWAQEDDMSHKDTKSNPGMSMDNDIKQNLDVSQNLYESLNGTQDIPSLEEFHSRTILVDAFGPNVWDDTVERDIVTEGLSSAEFNHSKQVTETEPTIDEIHQKRVHETSVPLNFSLSSFSIRTEIESRDMTKNHPWTKDGVNIVDIQEKQDAAIASVEEKSEDLLLRSASHRNLENDPKIASEADTGLANIKDDKRVDTPKKKSTSSNTSQEGTDLLKSLPKLHETKHEPGSSTGKNRDGKYHDSDKEKASYSNKSTTKKDSLQGLPESLSSDFDSSASDIEESGPRIPVVKDWTSVQNDKSKEQDIQEMLSMLKKGQTYDKAKTIKTEKLSLLNMAIHNAAQKKSDEEAKSDPKKKQYTVFSPQVYMETAWEAASTQITQKAGKSLHTISLRRWWDRDIFLLESMCRDGNAPAVRLLLKEGCNPGTLEKPRASPLIFSVKGGTAQHYKCVQALMRKGVNLDVTDKRTGKTALQLAIELPYFKGHTNLVRDLAAGGAKIDTKDYNGEGPIHSVFRDEGSLHLEKFRLDALACLLKADINGEADVNVPTGHELSCPLHLAVRRNSPMAVGMLLYKGAKINAKNSFGLTPLSMAATQWGSQLSEDQETVLKLLLQSPYVKVNEKSGMCMQTALHQAVLHASPSAVKILVDFNVSTSIRNSNGKTAVDLANGLDKKKWGDERKKILDILQSKD